MKSGLNITQMRDELLRQSGAKADYVVDTRCLEMDYGDTGMVLRMLDERSNDLVEPLDINQIAHRQIGTQLKIPAPYYDRMMRDNPTLLAHNTNTWFRQEPSQRMLRTLDGTARAYLSNRYRRIDHLEILQSVLPVLEQIPDAQFESSNITDNRMYLKVVNPRLETEVAKGDVVQAGIMISNSETGMGAVCVQPLVFRLVCLNGMIVNDAKTRKNHVGRVQEGDENFQLFSDRTLEADDHAFLLKIQDTVRSVVDEALFHQVVSLMKDATQARMNTADIPTVVKLAGRDFGISEAESNGVLNRLIEDHDLTLYGLANAVTRYSQDVESYDRATDLEGIGYNILSMPQQQWHRLNQVSGVSIAA